MGHGWFCLHVSFLILVEQKHIFGIYFQHENMVLIDMQQTQFSNYIFLKIQLADEKQIFMSSLKRRYRLIYAICWYKH